MTNVVKFSAAPANHGGTRYHPRTFTTQEAFIEELRELVITSRKTYTALAIDAGLSPSTVGNLASGKTQWPRHTTLFAMLGVLRKQLQIIDAE